MKHRFFFEECVSDANLLFDSWYDFESAIGAEFKQHFKEKRYRVYPNAGGETKEEIFQYLIFMDFDVTKFFLARQWLFQHGYMFQCLLDTWHTDDDDNCRFAILTDFDVNQIS